MVKQAILDKFKRLYEEKYNITLSDEEVTDLATKFINLMKILITPDKEEEQFDEHLPKQKII